ncbi:MAG: aldo/keto reductase [Sphingomonadales bacterium]|nr:aldo/keto reductase [Sphingomonadales bacterium]
MADWAAGHAGLGGIRLVFGGNVFGWTLDRDRSFAVLDAFYECGGRMIDTAEGYSAWIPGNKGGESEAIIGEWLQARGVRGDMRLGTKTGMGGPPGAYAPDKVAAALAGSLERLRTDYVDLYYVHRDDVTASLADIVAVFDGLAATGLARELGVSNMTADRLTEANAIAARHGKRGFTVCQPQYNLVWRGDYEGALQQACVAQGVAALPYYGLASGFLTGKFGSEADWHGSTRAVALKGFADNGGWRTLEAMRAVAAETGATLAAIALAWLNSRPGVAAPLASATSPAQVREICAGATLTLTPGQLAVLETA